MWPQFHVKTVHNDTDAPQTNLDCSVERLVLNNYDKISKRIVPEHTNIYSLKANTKSIE